MFNPFDSIEIKDGKQIVTQVTKNHTIDLNEFLSMYQQKQFQMVEIKGDEKII